MEAETIAIVGVGAVSYTHLGVILFAVGIIGGGIAFGIAAANGEWHRGRWGIFHGTGTVVEAEYPGETIERVVVDMGAVQLKICLLYTSFYPFFISESDKEIPHKGTGRYSSGA